MYQLLLSFRYLSTRHIALASVISVTLGVATMIVVNSVMAGFKAEMHKRLHGILADVVLETHSTSGAPDPAGHMARIRRAVGSDKIAGMTAVVATPAMVSMKVRGQWVNRQVNVIGIDEASYASVSDFGQYLLHPENRRRLSFALREGGYDVQDPEAPDRVEPRLQLQAAGWEHRRRRVGYERELAEQMRRLERQAPLNALDPFARQRAADQGGSSDRIRFQSPEEPPAGESGGVVGSVGDAAERSESPPFSLGEPQEPPPSAAEPIGDALPPPVAFPEADGVGSPFLEPNPEAPPRDAPISPPPVHAPAEATTEDLTTVVPQFDELHDQHPGIILGISVSSVRRRLEGGAVEDFFLSVPGDDVTLTFPNAGTPPKPISDTFTLVDFYESKMSEYDSAFAFVPLKKLQQLRGMIDPLTGQTAFTSIQIKVADGVDPDEIRDALREEFPTPKYAYRIQTWRDMQGPLLQAVQMETTILNILLFLIIAVAGFGILATFFMIVVEKTRDIGILKSLGAPSGGVMNIFLGYGVALGALGSGAGMVLGLLFVYFINDIAAGVEWLTGREVFDPTIYYFREIPTIIDPWTVGWIVMGAVLIAVLAAVLPALRAARMHPVEALRWE